MTTERHLTYSHGWSYSMVRAIWQTKGGQYSDRATARLAELHRLEHARLTPTRPHDHDDWYHEPEEA